MGHGPSSTPLAGLEFVEKLLTTNSPARTRRSGTRACFGYAPLVALLVGYWLELLIALVVAGARSCADSG
jgi:hypothetical protein